MRVLVSVALLFTIGTCFAQGDSDSLAHQKFLTLVNANRQQSYVTFGNGIGNLEPVLFEAGLSSSFFFSKKQKNWALLLNPQVQMHVGQALMANPQSEL